MVKNDARSAQRNAGPSKAYSLCSLAGEVPEGSSGRFFTLCHVRDEVAVEAEANREFEERLGGAVLVGGMRDGKSTKR